jgi:nucleotide-binding universal stress UspA family protein
MWAPGALAPLANSPELVDTLIANVRRILDRELGAEIPSAVRDALVVRAGRAGVVLGDVARERGASLIVVGRRHHGALARGRGGSTAHHLVRTTNVPVLVVEPSAPAVRPKGAAGWAAEPVCTWCDPRSGRCS